MVLFFILLVIKLYKIDLQDSSEFYLIYKYMFIYLYH